MDAAWAKLAFQVINDRYDYRRSTAITTSRPFNDWTQVFPDPLNAHVIAEDSPIGVNTSCWRKASAPPVGRSLRAEPAVLSSADHLPCPDTTKIEAKSRVSATGLVNGNRWSRRKWDSTSPMAISMVEAGDAECVHSEIC
jgi:hypothetical protein